MAYTPINWQTGDTITAAGLNKMDNGWGVSQTQLFSETVTTETQEELPAPAAILAYTEPINAPSIVVTFDNVDYTVQRTNGLDDSSYFYGEAGESGPDFTNYPFFIVALQDDPAENLFYTETAGTYVVSVSGGAIMTGNAFNDAVQIAGENYFAKSDAQPLIIELGITTFSEVATAINAGRSVYYRNFSNPDNAWYIYVVTYVSFSDYSVGGITRFKGQSQISTWELRANSIDGTLS